MPDKRCACPEHERFTAGVDYSVIKLLSLKSTYVASKIVKYLGIERRGGRGHVCDVCYDYGKRHVHMAEMGIEVEQQNTHTSQGQEDTHLAIMTDSSCSVGTGSAHFTNLRPSPVLDSSSGMDQTTEHGQPTPARRDPSPILALALRELGIVALPSVLDQTSQLDHRGEDVMNQDPSPAVGPPSCVHEASQQHTHVGEAPEDLQTPDLGTAGSHGGSEGTINTPACTPKRPRSRPSRAQRVTGAPSGTPKATWTTSPRS